MYSLFLIAALAQGAAVPSSGDLPAATAIAPPGAINGEMPAEASPKSNGGFFRRLFSSHAKNAPAVPAAATSSPTAATAVVPAAATSSPSAATVSPPKPKHGFFYQLFRSTDYDANFDNAQKWEKTRLGAPD